MCERVRTDFWFQFRTKCRCALYAWCWFFIIAMGFNSTPGVSGSASPCCFTVPCRSCLDLELFYGKLLQNLLYGLEVISELLWMTTCCLAQFTKQTWIISTLFRVWLLANAKVKSWFEECILGRRDHNSKTCKD